MKISQPAYLTIHQVTEATDFLLLVDLVAHDLGTTMQIHLRVVLQHLLTICLRRLG